MFDQTFVDGTARTKKPYTVVLSLLLQMAAISVLIFIPLLYSQTLPEAQLKSFVLTPPPPPPASPRAVTMKTRAVAVARVFSAKLVAPRITPRTTAVLNEVAAAPDLGSVGAPEEGNGGNGLLYGTGPASAVPPPPPPPPAKPRPVSGPVRVGGVVAEANVIRRVQPVYPPLAKSARVQGAVEFTAVISREGTVENLQLVHGHPLLVNAAREAILQWKYRPTLLNGQAVEVLTDITVNFTLAP